MSATIRSDHSRLSRVDRLWFRLEKGLAIAGGCVIFLLVLLATMNVLGRWLFDLPISGYIDWVEQAMAFMAFCGLAYTQRIGGHIRMDIVIGQLSAQRLWFAEAATTCLMFAMSLILIYGSWLHFLRAFQIGDSSLDIDLPIWPSKLVIPIALGILAVRLFLQLCGFVRAFRRRDSHPIAVPLPISASEEAAQIAADYQSFS